MSFLPSADNSISISVTIFKNLEHSIKSSVFDYQLFYKFQNSVKAIGIMQSTDKEYIQLMINVYQLSNIQTLFTIRKNSITSNDLAFQLKILTCEMICQIILYYDKQTQSAYQFPLNVLAEALQIMITTVRICLNQGCKHVSKILQFYRLINGPFEYAYDSISPQTKFIHYLNVLQIKKYKIQSEPFEVVQFQNRLRHLYEFKQIQSEQYREYVEYLVMEILLKTLKNGHFDAVYMGNFQQFLSIQYFSMLKSACQFSEQNGLNNIQAQGSQLFQLYSQIKNQGIQNVSLEYLQQFIKKPENFSNPSIFDIAALTLEPVVLQLWFVAHNSMKQSIQILTQAYKCFTYLVDKTNSIRVQSQIQVKKDMKYESYLRLAKNVILSLLTQKRDVKIKNSDPVFQIIKSLINLLIWLVFDLCKDFQKIKDLCQKIVLLCVKFSCLEVCKTIYSIQLYFQLLHRISSKQTYQNFMKSHQTQSSNQICRVLKAAYQFQNKASNQQNEQNLIILKNKPFLAILFGNQCTYLSILNLDIRQFIQIKCKFSIYLEIIAKFRYSYQHLSTILNHLQQTMIQLPMGEFFKEFFQSEQSRQLSYNQVKSIQLLRGQLSQIHKSSSFQKNNQINYRSSFVSLLLCFLQKEYLSLCKQINFGVVLNKFSKFIKILYAICDKIQVSQPNLIAFSKIYLVQCLEKFKTQTLRHQRLGEVGEVTFIQSVSMLVKQYYKKNSDQIDKKQHEFILFTIFELNCMSNCTEQYEKGYHELSLNSIRMFSQSVYIPKRLKQKYLRRLLRQNILTRQVDVTLNDFKDLIQMSQNQQERSLYLKHVISIHGEKGKNMVYLLANSNKRLQSQLSKSIQ